MTKTTRKLLATGLAAAVGAVVGALIATGGGEHSRLLQTGAPGAGLDNEFYRVLPANILWVVFWTYWIIASRNSKPTEKSESTVSTYFHQFLLAAALVLLLLPVWGLTGWFLPHTVHFVVALGATIQAASLVLAVWARRHLGHNWSGEVRIAVDHQLISSGPYKFLRHPIYTAMLGMFLGTAIASSQFHALIALVILTAAYFRKLRLE